MIDDAYEKLNMTEKENFSRVINQLLSRTFLLVDQYDPEEQISRVNRDYLFVDRNFALFQEYLALAGFHLERDTNYGVIQLISSYDGNRQRFNKLTTGMIYVLRLIYEEEREKLNLSKEVIIRIGDLVHKMLTLGFLQRKPSNADLHASLRRLSLFRIIEKLDGAWEDADTRILILPSILFVVSNEQISSLYQMTESVAAGDVFVGTATAEHVLAEGASAEREFAGTVTAEHVPAEGTSAEDAFAGKATAEHVLAEGTSAEDAFENDIPAENRFAEDASEESEFPDNADIQRMQDLDEDESAEDDL